MKTKLINKKIHYDGSQLRSLFAYLDHGLLGDSGIAFRGSCDVSFAHMVDGEDLLEQSRICGKDMLHFIFEIFDQNLFTGVLWQRLFAAIVAAAVEEQCGKRLQRSGDDLYLGKKKFSISIATRSPNSTMIHYAVNISNEGTPVPTLALSDLKLDFKKFAKTCLEHAEAEFSSIRNATMKVRAVP